MLKYTIVLLLLNYNIASNGSTYNDYCVNDSHCTGGYNCVSVETKSLVLPRNIPVSMCIEEPICSGGHYGNCPNFSNTSMSFIESKCVFSFINGCNTTAECYKNNNNDAYGIYKCIDTNTIIMLTDLYENSGRGDDRSSDRDNDDNTNSTGDTNIPIQTVNNDTNKPLVTNSYANKIISNVLCIIINFIIIIYLI